MGGNDLELLLMQLDSGVNYIIDENKEAIAPYHNLSYKNKEKIVQKDIDNLNAIDNKKDTQSFDDISRKLSDTANNLEDLKNMVTSFNGCKLKNDAINTVFAEGNENADVMLIGEAPGASEDKQGRPFCGRSGQLLDKMLDCIGLNRRDSVYITNTVFWRPPANRRPTNEEIEICRPFVEKHIALFKPKVIFLLGSTAVSSLLNITEPISSIRGKVIEYTNVYMSYKIPVIPSFHPAYLLRQQTQKKLAWEDLKLLKSMIT